MLERLNSPSFADKTAYWILFVLGGVNVIAGLLLFSFEISEMSQFITNIFVFVLGLILIVLGYFTKQRSTTALIIAIVLYIVNGILTYFLTNNPSICAPIFQLIVIVLLYKGVAAIRFLNSE